MDRAKWERVNFRCDVFEKGRPDWLKQIVPGRTLAVAEAMFFTVVIPAEGASLQLIPQCRIFTTLHLILPVEVFIEEDLSYPCLLCVGPTCHPAVKLPSRHTESSSGPEGWAWRMGRSTERISLFEVLSSEFLIDNVRRRFERWSTVR